MKLDGSKIKKYLINMVLIDTVNKLNKCILEFNSFKFKFLIGNGFNI